MDDHRKEQWMTFLISLALSGLFVWATLTGAYEGDGWQNTYMRLAAPVAALFFIGGTLFTGASLLRKWTQEQEKEQESAIGNWLGCLLGVPALIVLALLLLVGVIWLIKTIWYAV